MRLYVELRGGVNGKLQLALLKSQRKPTVYCDEGH